MKTICWLLWLLCHTFLWAYPSQAEIVVLPESRLEVYFSPRGGAENAIVEAIHAAENEICVQAYSFTSQNIAGALVAAFQRGVRVRVILDKSQRTAKGSRLQSLREAGIPVLIDSAHAIAHNKVMVIDTSRVITGSFNFTKSAEERNAENLLIIDSEVLSREYKSNFERHAEHAQALLIGAEGTR